MFIYETIIKLHETDAAGRLFFSQQFKIVHDAYQELLDSLGLGLPVVLKKKNYFLPIVHAQGDYKKPLFVGDHLKVELQVKHLGKTSLCLSYQLFNQKNVLVGSAQTVHVAVAKKTGKKIPLPAEVRKALEKV